MYHGLGSKANLISLPAEILEAIIGLLKDDRDSLKSSSLTCRSFRPSCQKRLFSTITLAVDPQDFNAENQAHSRLYEVVTSNPAIADYVKSLKLQIQPSGRNGAALGHRGPASPPILLLLEAFKDIRNVQLRLGSAKLWESPSPSFIAALEALAGSSKISSLQLSFGTVSPSLLFYFPSVQHLTLWLAKVEKDNSDLGVACPKDAAQVPLQSLEVYDYFANKDFSRLFFEPNSVYDLRALERLHLAGPHVQDHLKYLAHCRSSLKQLKLSITDLISLFDINLSSLERLVGLTIAIDPMAFLPSYQDKISEILKDMADSITSLSGLRDIGVVFKHEMDHFDHVMSPFLRVVNARIASSPSLRSLGLHVIDAMGPEQLHDFVQRTIVADCPLAISKNILHISTTQHSP